MAQNLGARLITPNFFGGGSTVMAPDNISKENPAADWRTMRRIIAEDPDWSLATVPQLTELSIRHIVENFAKNSSIINHLLPKHQKSVLSHISTSLPIKITAPLVDDECYWERCCKARWEVCDVSAHGGSWKRMYFERHLQVLIELFVPETSDPAELNEALQLSSKIIKKLDIHQLLPPVKDTSKVYDFEDSSDAGSDNEDEKESAHLNFEPVLKALPTLEELHLTYSVHDCGMNFEWTFFQFTACDCLKLAQCVSACQTLKVFRLHHSKVDDDKVRVLMAHMLDHPSLIELNLSYNMIGDRGARALGKFLNNHSQLVKLILTDNKIRGPGGTAIAHALTKNTILQYLDLRHNHLSDEGGQAICRALWKNSTLKEINLSSNELGEPTALSLSHAVMNNSTISSVDLSCNKLGPEGGKHLRDGLEENASIMDMDLRLTECGQEAEYRISLILHRNREAARDNAVREKEARAPPQRKEADPQAAHRYQLPPDLVY